MSGAFQNVLQFQQKIWTLFKLLLSNRIR